MYRARFIRLWPYAAAIGVLILCLSVWMALEWQTASDLGSRAVTLVQVKWRSGWLLLVTVLAVIMEVFFLNWEKTTVFRVFVRRRAMATVDLAFALLTFSTYRWLPEYIFSFGAAFLAAKVSDNLTTQVGWMRWEMPSDGVLDVAGAFTVYYLMTTFVAYWVHRLLHWRWFWYLHRFHHSSTEYNIFVTFRVNPAEMVTNLIAVLSPLIFLKVPNAGLFGAFVLANQAIISFQHSELSWDFGWFGRWVISSPRNHQFHHSIDEEHQDKNFSNCPLWDQVFGTWYGGPNLPSGYGIRDPAHVDRPLTQWLVDIWIFYRDFTLAVAGSARRGWTRIVRGKQPVPQAVNTTISIPAE